MRPTHATLQSGGVSLEGSIAEIETMLSEGRLKIARHLMSCARIARLAL